MAVTSDLLQIGSNPLTSPSHHQVILIVIQVWKVIIYDLEMTETFPYPGVRLENTGDEKKFLNNSRSNLHKLSKSCSQVRMMLEVRCSDSHL